MFYGIVFFAVFVFVWWCIIHDDPLEQRSKDPGRVENFFDDRLQDRDGKRESGIITSANKHNSRKLRNPFGCRKTKGYKP
jgi:hypothetical protein